MSFQSNCLEMTSVSPNCGRDWLALALINGAARSMGHMSRRDNQLFLKFGQINGGTLVGASLAPAGMGIYVVKIQTPNDFKRVKSWSKH